MRFAFVTLLIISLCLSFTYAITDEEMYIQLNKFIQIHSNIPADKQLVAQILASTAWQGLVAQFGKRNQKNDMIK